MDEKITNVETVEFEGVKLKPGEEINPETIAELSNGKGEE